MKQRLTRVLITLAALITGLSLLALPARAELQIDLKGGAFKAMPIAVAEFTGDPQLAAQVSQIITNNLKRSGIFQPLDKASHPEKSIDLDNAPNFAAWRAANAQAVVNGRVSREGNRIKAEYRLWDVAAENQIIGQQYFTDPNASRRVAHMISDNVFERITGEKGFFDTRVVFVDETGSKEKRRKRLAMVDQDGANFRALSSGEELAVTPRFSPNSQDVTYMSFAGDNEPKVYFFNVGTGRKEAVGDFPGMSFAPRFAPDGNRIIMSLQQGANSNIYVMNMRGGGMTRLTSTAAIDTSPSYSPDGRQIAFESDRGGGQQIYIMGADGSGQKRVSFGDGSYSTPVWSPRGDYIAFTKRKGGRFAIGVMKPDGSGERIITDGHHNEGPTWAPNGRYVMFFRDSGGGPKLFMADITGRVEVSVPTPNYASDPAWSPLLSGTR